MFPDTRWNSDGVKTLIGENDSSGSVDPRPRSGRGRIFYYHTLPTYSVVLFKGVSLDPYASYLHRVPKK